MSGRAPVIVLSLLLTLFNNGAEAVKKSDRRTKPSLWEMSFPVSSQKHTKIKS